jgi:hypothetical protein
MSDVATTEHKNGKLPAKRGRQPRISKPIRRACELLASGECKTIKAAAERVNVSREWLSRMLQRDHVRVFCERKSREILSHGMLRASSRMLELVDGPAAGTAYDAAKFTLAVNGIKPEPDQVAGLSVHVSAGFVVDLSGQAGTITAKPLIDNETGEQLDDVQVR